MDVQASAGLVGREFVFSTHDFEVIRKLVSQHTGIVLTDAKRDMVYSRLVRRIRQLGLDSFSAYCERLLNGDGDELGTFINAITTNLTAFFRESHHFEFLAKTALPALMQQRQATRRLRIWSAGCSTGEEPYSLAIVVKEVVPATWDVKILATDLDTNVVATADRGVYSEDRVKSIASGRLRRWFLKGKGPQAGAVRVAPELRELITFRQMNLLGSWPMHGPFDVIFCRNVVIYFDKPTQKRLFERYADILAPDGYLFIGHSETLYRVTDRLQNIGQTTYKHAR
jgi:chemotaxis protein methyltransferase CheR